MRWLILLVLLPLILVGAKAKSNCHVRDFYLIAWSIHDPTERYKQMEDWLVKYQGSCKSTDYVVIWNNMAEWAGNADSHKLRGLVIRGYKDALEREKK